jgi:hypothetical protein
MATVITVVGVTALIYEVLERDYGVPRPVTGGTVTLPGGSGGLSQAQVQALIDASIAAIPAGTTDQAAVEAIIEAKLTEFAPMIQEAVQSQFKAMPKKIRLNTDDGQVGIEGLDISGPNKPVSLNMELPDGSLSVNGKRVLTVDDALTPGSVDQAALEAAVQAATAPLLARIAALETKLDTEIANTMGYIGEQNQNLTDLHAGDMTLVGQELAKKADVTVTDGLQNQIRLNTQYIDQQVGTVIQYADLALEKKAEKSALDDLNGPNATTDSIQQMFWLLNDVVMALIEATGIEIDGRVKP